MSEITEFEDNLLQIQSANYIMLCRIYDMLAIIAPEDKSIALRQMHERGETFAPAPYLVEDDQNAE
jgi:hypothetical protein